MLKLTLFASLTALLLLFETHVTLGGPLDNVKNTAEDADNSIKPPTMLSGPSMPSMPSMPNMPSMPSMPSMPDMPKAPGLSDLQSYLEYMKWLGRIMSYIEKARKWIGDNLGIQMPKVNLMVIG